MGQPVELAPDPYREAQNVSYASLPPTKLVTTATVFGGLGPFASASKTVLVVVVPGSEPSDQAGNCMSYFASEGTPSVWCTSTLL